MSRFYFDTDDGHAATRDAYGLELADHQEAYKVAVETLPDLAHGVAPSAVPSSVNVHVRNEHDQLVLEVSLVLVVKWTLEKGSESQPCPA